MITIFWDDHPANSEYGPHILLLSCLRDDLLDEKPNLLVTVRSLKREIIACPHQEFQYSLPDIMCVVVLEKGKFHKSIFTTLNQGLEENTSIRVLELDMEQLVFEVTRIPKSQKISANDRDTFFLKCATHLSSNQRDLIRKKVPSFDALVKVVFLLWKKIGVALPKKVVQSPDWQRLYEIARLQDGYFSQQQASELEYKSEKIHRYIDEGIVEPVAARDVYRFSHYPHETHEDLVIAWLWSKQQGVISHDTALSLHELSDVLPARVHITVPNAWEPSHRIPSFVVLHPADVSDEEKTWFRSVPITNVKRTLNDCARDGLSRDLLQQAARQALKRGLVQSADLSDVWEALESFGGAA